MKKLNQVYIIIKGDPSVGIPDDLYTISGFQEIEASEIELVRDILTVAFERITGEPASVQFDFELQAEIESEETWSAADLRSQAEYQRAQFPKGDPNAPQEPTGGP